MPEQSAQLIWPYTDLLLHDMGEGLADNRPEGDATGREWRTPPLWGIGLTETVSGHTNLLHDGRARNLLEAILWHGGEAERAKQPRGRDEEAGARGASRLPEIPVRPAMRMLSALLLVITLAAAASPSVRAATEEDYRRLNQSRSSRTMSCRAIRPSPRQPRRSPPRRTALARRGRPHRSNH